MNWYKLGTCMPKCNTANMQMSRTNWAGGMDRGSRLVARERERAFLTIQMLAAHY